MKILPSIIGLCGLVPMMWAINSPGLQPQAKQKRAVQAKQSNCVQCHSKTSPKVVTDWHLSKHSKNDVDCSVCHGTAHQTAIDYKKAKIPTPDTCAQCHPGQVEQFMEGKHSKAWVVMNAMPAIHYQPMMLIEGMKGCGGCHKIGTKTPEEIKKLEGDGGVAFGTASCDSCHTRHSFSKKEAQQPQACQTCHMGIDHPHWEMYSSSKHGVRNGLKQSGVLPPDTSAPTCQTCHMQDGHHGVKTAWGFLAVRLPFPDGDKQWTDDRVTVLQGLGVLDPEGKPTARLEAVKAADVARLDQASWQASRDQMLKACTQCHSRTFANGELEKGDKMIREADHLMAQGIKVVAGLYQDGTLPKPKEYSFAFPDLLTFHDAPTTIEHRLHKMFLEHRMRTFQGTFHANPDYALWYGWSEMKQDLVEIQTMADELRDRKK